MMFRITRSGEAYCSYEGVKSDLDLAMVFIVYFINYEVVYGEYKFACFEMLIFSSK